MQASEPARGASTAAPPAPPAGEVATLSPVGADDALTALGPERFSNRELSWLEFGARLLELAGDDRVPLLERVKFLAIFSEGLDEFFQVRVAGLKDQVDAGLRTRSADGLRPSEALRAIGVTGDRARRPAVARLPRLGRARPGRGRGAGGGLVVARRRRPPRT